MKRFFSAVLIFFLFTFAAAEDAGDILAAYRAHMGAENAMEALMDADLCYLPGYDDFGLTGYAFLDLDGDGAEELVIAAIAEADDAFSYGLLYDVYTRRDGVWTRLLVSRERDRYYLCADGTILNEYSGSAMESGWVLYRMVDAALTRLEALEYNADENPDAPWSLWTEGAWQPADEESAAAWIARFDAGFIAPALTPLRTEP